jgi:hypothetical protein
VSRAFQRRPGTEAAESPLAWLRSRSGKSGEPMIDDACFAAGERLRHDFALAAVMGHVTMNWESLAGPLHRRTGAGGGGNEAAAAARRSVAEAVSAVGAEFAGVLIEICCQETGLCALEKKRGWPPRSGKVVLKLALKALADHYGFGREAVGQPGAGRISRWGAADYRPTA